MRKVILLVILAFTLIFTAIAFADTYWWQTPDRMWHNSDGGYCYQQMDGMWVCN